MELIFDGPALPDEKLTGYMKKVADKALKNEGILSDETEISVTFVDLEEIRQINRDFRGIDEATDVLSFPQFESPDEIPKEGIAVLGDVVICLDKVEQQAGEFGHSRERELMYLFTHSILHLLGYDHMNDEEKKVMRLAEESIMDSIGLTR